MTTQGYGQGQEQGRFTSEEWRVLSNAPAQIGGAIASAAPSGLVGTAKEGAFIVTSIMNAAKQHPHNPLIQAVVPRGVDTNQAMGWAQIAQGLIQTSEVDRVKRESVATCQQVARILEQKATPQEREEFKSWLLEVGDGVARAANEGGNFFNVGGTQVSAQETQTLREIASALGLTQRGQA